eukprot:2377127-Amphidinium_carterae.1
MSTAWLGYMCGPASMRLVCLCFVCFSSPDIWASVPRGLDFPVRVHGVVAPFQEPFGRLDMLSSVRLAVVALLALSASAAEDGHANRCH